MRRANHGWTNSKLVRDAVSEVEQPAHRRNLKEGFEKHGNWYVCASSSSSTVSLAFTGYQKILGYAHWDGSFSAFGNDDEGGSMFLTAFVVRTLRQMQEYVDIDSAVIDKAVGFIIEHQMANGCFDPASHVFYQMVTFVYKSIEISCMYLFFRTLKTKTIKRLP